MTFFRRRYYIAVWWIIFWTFIKEEKADVIKIQFLENKNNFSEDDWKELTNLSENIFVEETEELKQKTAGAGLSDND